jgi:hypothetical protein
LVSKLRYRELREELSQRQLPHDGTTTQLRDRLRKAAIVECNLTETGELDENCQVRSNQKSYPVVAYVLYILTILLVIAHRHGRTAGSGRICRRCRSGIRIQRTRQRHSTQSRTVSLESGYAQIENTRAAI